MGNIDRANAFATPKTSHHMKVLFLHPKTLVDSWPVPIDTLGEIVKFPSAVYPVLAAAIADLPVRMEIFDGYVARETFAGYKQRLRWPDLIAISCMSPLKALDTELTIRLAKQLNPAVRVVVGGNHATAWPERWMEAGADFVVVGEGEVAFRRLIETLLADGDDFQDIPSLYWREGGAIHRSDAKPSAIDLNAAPMPDWRGFDLGPYGMGMSGGMAAAVEISRGCPHRCDFCNINTFWSHKQQYKSVARVIAELERLKDMGVGEIIFTDDNFGGNEKHTIALLEEMVRRRIDIKFGCFLRGDTVARNPGFPALAAAAGMRFCMMGIETLDEAWLKQHRKGVRSADAPGMYAEVYERLRASGIFVNGLFICSPSENTGAASGVGATGVVCDYRMSSDLQAIKGSALYDKVRAADAVSKDMFYHDTSLTSIVLDSGTLQVQQGSRLDLLREHLGGRAFRALLGGSPVARRFWWRPPGVILERLLCTTRDDLRRRRLSQRADLTMQQRQEMMVQTVLDKDHIARLARRRRWVSPLSLRNGLWSARPKRPKTPEAASRNDAVPATAVAKIQPEQVLQ